MQHCAQFLQQPGACTCSGSAKPPPHAFRSCPAQLWRQASRRPWHWHQERRPCAKQLSVRLRTTAQLRRQPHTALQLPRRPHAVAVQASSTPGPAAPFQTPLQIASGGALGPGPGPTAQRRSSLQAVEALHEGAARPAPPAQEPPPAAGTAQSVGGAPAGQAVPEVLQSVSDAVLLPAGSGGSSARVPEYWQARCFRPAVEYLS